MNRREMRRRIWSAVWQSMVEVNAGMTVRRNGNRWDKTVVYRSPPNHVRGLQHYLDVARDSAFKFTNPSQAKLDRWNKAEREVLDSIFEHTGLKNYERKRGDD